MSVRVVIGHDMYKLLPEHYFIRNM